jgi:hypothetical protein
VISANAYVCTSVELGTALSNDNRSSGYRFTSECLDAQALACTITTVAGRPATFFMCHLDVPFFCSDAAVNYFVEIDVIFTDVKFCR